MSKMIPNDKKVAFHGNIWMEMVLTGKTWSLSTVPNNKKNVGNKVSEICINSLEIPIRAKNSLKH